MQQFLFLCDCNGQYDLYTHTRANTHANGGNNQNYCNCTISNDVCLDFDMIKYYFESSILTHYQFGFVFFKAPIYSIDINNEIIFIYICK